MGLQIEDGTGSSNLAKVNDENSVEVSAICITKITASSEKHGSSYVWTAYVDWGADKNAVWLRNDSSDLKLHIDKLAISPPAAAVIEIWVGSGNVVAGTEIIGVNLNRGSGNSANATCRHTNTNVDAGAGMTLLGTMHLPGTVLSILDFGGSLILDKNSELAINMVTDVGATAINIIGYFHN